jgi:hypothetical protein
MNMQNAQYPDFKSGFKYQNIGNIVGTLNYAKAMKRKDGTEFGVEFLINAKGFGSINVRIPMMDRAQTSLDNYPVEDKPRIRAGLSRIEQFTSDKGITYTNATTFVELSDAVTVNGDEMKDNIAGRLAGEVFNIQPIRGDKGAQAIRFNLVTYPVDRKDEKNRATQADGTPVDPQVIAIEAHDPAIIGQMQQTVRQGSNVEIGYKYFNKSNVAYDEYGYPINDPNDVIERIEVGKLVVHGAPQDQGAFGGQNQNQGQQQGFGSQGQQGGFGGQQQGFGGQQQQQQQGFGQQQQQQNPYANQQQQQPPQENNFGSNPNQGNPYGNQQPQGDPFANQNQGQQQKNFGVPDNQFPFDPSYQGGQQGSGSQQQFGSDPFAGKQELSQGDMSYEEAQKMFGQNNQNTFGFGN